MRSSRSMSQGGWITLKIAPEMRCVEVPLSGVISQSCLMKTAEHLYRTVGPGWCPIDPSYRFRDRSIRLFHEGGSEIPMDKWEQVVHAGMVAVMEFTPVTTRACSRSGGLECMAATPDLLQTSRIESSTKVSTSPPAMSSPPMHKAVGLERYPGLSLYTPARPRRPSNLRIHSLPSISEQSSNIAADDDVPMFPRSMTPSPSPPPWKVLFQRAKARDYPKSERDYFSSRSVPTAPALRWASPAWVSSPEEVQSPEDYSDHDQPHYDSAMDVEMHVGDEIVDERILEVSEQSPKEEPISWESAIYHTPTIINQHEHVTVPPSIVLFTNKRKRGYDSDREDETEDMCGRTVKRPMAAYHRARLHSLLQAV